MINYGSQSALIFNTIGDNDLVKTKNLQARIEMIVGINKSNFEQIVRINSNEGD